MPGVLEALTFLYLAAQAGALGAGLAAVGAAYGGSFLALGASLAASYLLRPKAPELPKPEDGKYNLRQAVPSGAIILGTVKKGFDYLALEETNGVAYHVGCPAMHRINGYVQHYLHDEAVTLDGSGVVNSPAHFGAAVTIKTRLGLDAETAYSELVTAMPSIWTEDHRGDGLATVMMSAVSVAAEAHQSVYPQNMPQHSSVIEGALLYDPRDESTAFSTNLALMRLFHLTHASGLKLALDDLHMADWENAADVCDIEVTNKQEETEPQYHGGFWYRFDNDPVTVGRTIDQAAELVLYETADGKVGVHAGEFVEPDVRLAEVDIHSITFDANRRRNTNVTAVRGRYTDPTKLYNTVDAAIVGEPYPDEEGERTKTVENVAVQSHNHMQRLQAIAKIRANAPRVRILCDYEPAKLVPYRRFVKVHYPPKLEEAIVEVTGRPKLSLRNLTYEFEGIVVPATLYDFVAATDEGDPPAEIVELEPEGVPVPAGFEVAIETETLVNGGTAAYGVGTWDTQSDALTVEMEWEPSAGGGVLQSVRSSMVSLSIRTGYLADGVEYKFRARNWSGGVPSAWTDYVYRTPITDSVAPADLVDFDIVGGPEFIGHVAMTFTTPIDPHLRHIAIYAVPSGGVLDTDDVSQFLVRLSGVPTGSTFGRTQGDSTISPQITNDMSSSVGWFLGTGFSIGAGVMTAAAGSSSAASRTPSAFSAGDVWRFASDVTISAGSFQYRLAGGAQQLGTAISTAGRKLGSVTAVSGNTSVGILKSATMAGTFDNFLAYIQTPACAPQGAFDLYAVPENGSFVEGAAFGPVAVIIV